MSGQEMTSVRDAEEVILEEASKLVITWWNGRRQVIRKQPGHADDLLGEIDERKHDLFVAILYSRFIWVGEVECKSFQQALAALVNRTPYSREQAYWHESNRQRAASCAEMDRDRRRNPHWYNADGSHIGINSDGTYRNSYKNGR